MRGQDSAILYLHSPLRCCGRGLLLRAAAGEMTGVRKVPRACLERPTGGAPVQGPRPVSPTRHGANREPKPMVPPVVTPGTGRDRSGGAQVASWDRPHAEEPPLRPT